MVEKDFAVSASEIRHSWPAMDEHERMDFASNWWHTNNWTDEDTQILETIMSNGDDRIWQCCTQAFLKIRSLRSCSMLLHVHPSRHKSSGQRRSKELPSLIFLE